MEETEGKLEKTERLLAKLRDSVIIATSQDVNISASIIGGQKKKKDETKASLTTAAEGLLSIVKELYT